MQNIFLFIVNDLNRIKRKWISLPLLFILPFLLVGVLIWVILDFTEAGDSTFEVGIVNLDHGEEATVLISTILEASDLSENLILDEYEETEALEALEENEIAGYIVFPDRFYTGIISGHSTELEVIGNPEQPLESYVLRDIVDTMAQHIRASQANILTIDYYAHEFGIDEAERREMNVQNFTNYFLQVMSSSTMVDEHEVTPATSNGATYFIVNGLFLIITFWLLALHMMLEKEIHIRMEERMKLLGAKDMDRAIARVSVVASIIIIFSAVFLYVITQFDDLYITFENFLRVLLLMSLYVIITTLILVIIAHSFKSMKVKLLMQIVAVFFIVFFAGAIIPPEYLPLYVRDILNYIYSYESLHWIENIMLNGRYTFKITTTVTTIIILILGAAVITIWKGLKER